MSAAKHTPGPWVCDEAIVGDKYRNVLDGNDMRFGPAICRVFVEGVGYWHQRESQVSEANARLIAAAPDLLAIVRISIGNVRSLGPAGALANVAAPYEVWLSALEAAYFKATGEQP
jgi:hypothetical protein